MVAMVVLQVYRYGDTANGYVFVVKGGICDGGDDEEDRACKEEKGGAEVGS